jgi:hemerythrin superfamily protein
MKAFFYLYKINNMPHIVKFMDIDHSYLSFLWEDFIKEKSDFNQARKYLEKFEKHLLLHMELEDEHLFKRLDNHIGTVENSGLIATTKEDHKIIIKLLGLIKEALQNGNREKLVITAKNFNKALVKHKNKELELQYPVSEAFIEPKEWNEIILSIYGKEMLNKIQKRTK